MNPIELNETSGNFAKEVEAMSHANLSRCWHCLACSGGCPFAEDMEYLPNAVIRMIQFGLKEKVLKSNTIWLCVGCNTCSMECPNSVDMAAIMDALRQMALLEQSDIAEPGILSFHRAVIHSIFRHGRTHKLEIMMKYKFSEKDLFSDDRRLSGEYLLGYHCQRKWLREQKRENGKWILKEKVEDDVSEIDV